MGGLCGLRCSNMHLGCRGLESEWMAGLKINIQKHQFKYGKEFLKILKKIFF